MSTFKSRANRVLSSVIGRYTSLEFSHGQGCYLYDTQNKAYLDFSSGIGVTATGHCHPKVVEAIQKQAETLIHPCIGVGYYEPPIALAEKLASLVPHDDFAIFFNQSGSEAVETAIKLAKYVSKRSGIVAFKGGFHGRSLGALSVTTSKQKYRDGYEPLLANIDFFPYPNGYRCEWSNKEDSLHESIMALEKSDLFNDSVAAVIIEPILGEGGYYMAPPAFLKALEDLCKKKQIYLIFDEIQSGIGRTGKWFYFQHYHLKPDIITVAKGIASGMPLAACMAKKSIMNQWPAGSHGGTYGGNPVICAAASASLDVLAPRLNEVARLGDIAKQYLKDQLLPLRYIGDIRAKGLMIGIEFVKDKNSKCPDPDRIKKVMSTCLDKQLIVISCGIHDNVIRLIPPLIINEETLMMGLKRFVVAVKGI